MQIFPTFVLGFFDLVLDVRRYSSIRSFAKHKLHNCLPSFDVKIWCYGVHCSISQGETGWNAAHGNLTVTPCPTVRPFCRTFFWMLECMDGEACPLWVTLFVHLDCSFVAGNLVPRHRTIFRLRAMYSNLRRSLIKHWKFVTICGQTCGSGGIEMFGACQTACRRAWKPCAMVNGTIARKRDLWVRAVATRNALPYIGNLLGTKKKYHDPQTLAGSYLYNRHMQPFAFPKN